MTSEELKRLEDKFDHAISLARQSTPDSLCPMLSDIRREIRDIKDWGKKYEPILDRLGKNYNFADSLGSFFVSLTKAIVGVGILAGAFVWIKQHFYR